MDASLVARVLWLRRRLRARETRTAERLRAHRDRALSTLRAHALARSPFYSRLHAGLEWAPLEALPIVAKADLMGRFDEVVTDPVLRIADLERHLAAPDAAGPFTGGHGCDRRRHGG
jgi:hypothetical protein